MTVLRSLAGSVGMLIRYGWRTGRLWAVPLVIALAVAAVLALTAQAAVGPVVYVLF